MRTQLLLLFSALACRLSTTTSAHPGHAAGLASFAPHDVILVATALPEGAPRRSNRPGEDRSGDQPSGALKNEVSITVEGGYRVIRANGIPDHEPGQFPNRGNPNRLGAQNHTFRMPVKPQPAALPVPLGMHPFGVAVNGVVFDPGAAEWWRGDRNWQYEPMSGTINLGVDQHNAHVQPNGAYHYHAIPTGLLTKLTDGQPRLALVGWAADGFPIYGPWGYSVPKDTKSRLKKLQSSYRVKQGARPDGPGGKYDGSFVADYEYVKGAGDLDECNGRQGVTPEFPNGTYHYVLTGDFPFIPRLFRGTPDASFFRHGPDGGRGPGGPGGPGGFGPPRHGPPGRFGPEGGFPPLRSDRDGRGDTPASAAGSFSPPPFPREFPALLEDWTAADWDSFFEGPPSFARHRGEPPHGWPPPPPPHWGGFPPPPFFR